MSQRILCSRGKVYFHVCRALKAFLFFLLEKVSIEIREGTNSSTEKEHKRGNKLGFNHHGHDYHL